MFDFIVNIVLRDLSGKFDFFDFNLFLFFFGFFDFFFILVVEFIIIYYFIYGRFCVC